MQGSRCPNSDCPSFSSLKQRPAGPILMVHDPQVLELLDILSRKNWAICVILRFLSHTLPSHRRKSPLAPSRTTAYFFVMNYLTVEVEIDHGRVSAKGAQALPEKACGLLTILEPKMTQPRPIGLATGQFRVPDLTD
jgi:hypothetical protein